jgi:hypothetical protein
LRVLGPGKEKQRDNFRGNELYSAVLLLYGTGKLRKEYRARIMEAMKSGALMKLLDVFAIVDIKAERKLDAWRLRIL